MMTRDIQSPSAAHLMKRSVCFQRHASLVPKGTCRKGATARGVACLRHVPLFVLLSNPHYLKRISQYSTLSRICYIFVPETLKTTYMPVIEITSLAHPGVDIFATLTEAQLRNRLEPDKGIFIAESPKVIRVALKAEPRLAIVMGTEGDGLPAETIAEADYVVRIPMAHGVDSLNVAAASAVAFWELRKL